MKAQKRVCGSCTACCKTHEIIEIGKQAGVWCHHCNPGVGCSIYPERSFSCRVFKCEWLKGRGSDAQRPDRTNIIFDYVKTRNWLSDGILQIVEVEDGALSLMQLDELILEALAKNFFLLKAYISGRKVLFVPPLKHLTKEWRLFAAENGFEVQVLTGP
ncbi:MAG: hypothetical protein ABSE76_02100 [Minisyncoccia bacterium]|jgi:hypothetical protein